MTHKFTADWCCDREGCDKKGVSHALSTPPAGWEVTLLTLNGNTIGWRDFCCMTHRVEWMKEHGFEVKQ